MEQSEEAKARDLKARELYLEGETDYAAGRYEDAAAKFASAYELSKRSALLFNMANAYERMGDYQNALFYLERYLESPKVEDVVSVRERINRLRATVAASRAVTAAAAEPTTPPVTVPGDARERGLTTQPSDIRAPERWPAYLLFSAGGTVIAGSVLFGLASRRAADDAAADCSLQVGSLLCSSQAKAALERERRYAVLADLSAAAAVAAAGVGLYFMLRSGPRAPTASGRTGARAGLAPWIVPGGLGLGVSGAL